MRSSSRQRPAPARPDEINLHEAALRHLARYACSVSGLIRVLDRRVDRWAREGRPEATELAAAREAARQVAERLRAAGAVDDAAFAEGRARSLARAGRSGRAIAAHLLARGIPADLARESLPQDPEHDLAAALMLARRRRLGPFRLALAVDPVLHRRELAALGRAGFTESLARRVLVMERPEAEMLLLRQRESG